MSSSAIWLQYSFVDPQTGESEQETKNFVVSGIMESTGNPTIDEALVINEDWVMHYFKRLESLIRYL
jgi:hypothetical protein